MLKAPSNRFSTLYEPEFRKDGRLPLIMISQLSRSGGTMMSQLLDGIPEILAYPRELHLGAYKTEIPDLDSWCERPMNIVREAFIKANSGLFELAAQGRYDKGSGSYLPFFFDQDAFNYLFEKLWQEQPPRTGRDLASVYFTAFFTAWIDMQRPLTVKPCYISAFASWTALSRDNVIRMFNYYPDGYLIQLIRDPVSWYSSVKARVLAGRGADLAIYQGLDSAVKAYMEQAESINHNLDEFAVRCILIDYDALAKATASVMCGLLNMLRIRATEIAMIPTFNSRPIGPNSSFRGLPYSREDILEADELRILQDKALPAYAALRKRARFLDAL
jgi:hypothetical protein